MYFNLEPKTERKDLYGQNYLIDTLLRRLQDQDTRLVVLKGLRRTGKTSLLNVALNELNLLWLKIDVREYPLASREEFLIQLVEKIKLKLGESVVDKILKKISALGLSYGGVGATIYFQEKYTPFFFEELNAHLKTKKKQLILAFDEAQLLRKINLENLLAAIYDNYPQIKLVFTGSEVGVLDKLLGKRDAGSPLFGRAAFEIETKRLTPEQIHEFIQAGFGQIKKEIKLEEVQKVIEELDGIVGWATYYGWLRSKDISHRVALQKTIAEGSLLVKRELDNFLERRKKSLYINLLKVINSSHNRWNLIKISFLKQKTPLSDRQLGLSLKELEDYGFIEKINETYNLADPLLSHVLD